MRKIDHWTPRYIVSRISEKIYRQTHPGLPWLTQTANQILETLLLPSDSGLEFGSGRSTLWFAARTAHLISVEHNPEWYAQIRGDLADKRFENVDYRLYPGKDRPVNMADLPAYVKVVQTIPDNSLDYVLVDGIFREACALLAIKTLKPGGFLIIDNVNLYLPSNSYSPNSRKEEDGPVSHLWGQFLRQTKDWRKFWTSNNISDTAFFIKG